MKKQYKILEAGTAEELTNKVNVLMDYGWSIEGGMILDEGTNGKYKQTMFRTMEGGGVSGNGKQLLNG